MENKVFKRINVLDALRGFSLLGVILIHMQQQYSYFGGRMLRMMGPPVEPSRFDNWVNWLTNEVMMGKFINIFAFLFGMSFFIQMDRAKARGIDFRGRFCWRMIVLLIIGTLSSMFYSGDILPIYAFFGLILLLLDRCSNKVLAVLVALLLIGTPRMATTAYDRVTAEQTVQPQAPQMPDFPPFPGPDQVSVEKPSFMSVVEDNLTAGARSKLNYQFGLVGRGYVTLALFMLGLIVGRIRFFETLDQHKKRNVAVFLIFASLTVGLAYVLKLFPQPPFWAMMQATDLTFPMLVRMGLADVRMVLYSASLAMGFILLYQIPAVGKVLDVLSPYGRMGLTNFVMQGVIGAVLFAPWGYQQVFGVMKDSHLFLIGLGIYAVQIVLSHIWLRFFRYGPLEWLWRSATYMKFQPFLK